MSNQQSSFTSFSSTSYSSYSTSSSGDGQPHTQSYTESANYDSRHGGSMERSHAETGKPTLVERTEIPAAGGRIAGNNSESLQGRIQDVSDDPEQAAKDQQYLEKMEDEYAKREGGA